MPIIHQVALYSDNHSLSDEALERLSGRQIKLIMQIHHNMLNALYPVGWLTFDDPNLKLARDAIYSRISSVQAAADKNPDMPSMSLEFSMTKGLRIV